MFISRKKKSALGHWARDVSDRLGALQNSVLMIECDLGFATPWSPRPYNNTRRGLAELQSRIVQTERTLDALLDHLGLEADVTPVTNSVTFAKIKKRGRATKKAQGGGDVGTRA